jgi:hypothetical protein
MRKILAHAVCLGACAILIPLARLSAHAAEPVRTNSYVLTLRYPMDVKLSEPNRENLYANALRLVRTSNFNSEAPRWDWDMAKLREQYRQSIEGSYLRIIFSTPQKLKTVGGELMTREIMIGLSGTNFASPVFTLDERGALVGHAKYDGGMCVRMLDLVKAIAPVRQAAP